MQTRRTSAPTMVQALVRFLVWAGVLFWIFFYGGLGWVFSDTIKQDALDISPYVQERDVEVTAATSETVALIAEVGSNARDEGWFGINWDGGNGLVGPIVERIADTVVREFVLIDGDPVQPGDMVEVTAWMWSDPSAFGADFDLIRFGASLGELDAWRIDAGSDDWVIVVHGKGATKQEGLRLASILHSAGISSLLIDYRNDDGAPQDPSGQYQYGLTEWDDVESAVQYVRGQGATSITIAGLSTGAAHTLSFMYRSPLSSLVDGLIFDSANIDMEQAIRHGASQEELPFVGFGVPNSLSSSAIFIAERRFDIDIDAWNYLTRIDDIRVPMLVIHGDSDETVPHAVSVDLVTARPDLVTYEEFPGAGHVESWNSDQSRYNEVVLRFMSRDS